MICSLVAPTLAIAAPKALTPQAVHVRIVKLGVGNWTGVRLQTGVAFSGKVVSIDEKGFALLQYGYQEPTPVAYGNVFSIETGMPVVRPSKKPLTAEAAHAKLLKRGLGNWVGVQLENGVAFSGRLVSVDENSFGLQL
jgi:small nuclear ribonucleoprotein (snRNP)-like protein